MWQCTERGKHRLCTINVVIDDFTSRNSCCKFDCQIIAFGSNSIGFVTVGIIGVVTIIITDILNVIVPVTGSGIDGIDFVVQGSAVLIGLLNIEVGGAISFSWVP